MHCQYRTHRRFADITIGDFWGIDKLTGKTEKDGVSCLIVNSQKGKSAIEQVAEFANLKQFAVEDVLYRVATKPPVSKIDTYEFWNVYRQNGYEGLVKKYCKSSLKIKLAFELQKRRRKSKDIKD